MLRASRVSLSGLAFCLACLIACALSAPAGADLYVNSPETESILQANLDGSGLVTLLSGEASFGAPGFGGIAVGGGHIFWTWEGGIGRANIDGSEANKDFLEIPAQDVAVRGNELYWSGGSKIGRANVDGTEVEPNFISNIPGGSTPGIAVTSEYIYWTEFWQSAIGRAKLDGSEVEQEWVIGTHTPMGLTADAQYLYWAITYENHIGRVRLDGSELTTNFIASGLSSNGNEEVGVTVYGSYIYWANPTTGTIGRAKVDGSEIEPNFIAGLGSPLGVTVLAQPAPLTKPATEVTSSTATLNAIVNPEGSEVSKCVLEYGTTTAYGSSVACSPAPGSGDTAVAVAASPTGLSPNTVYHYRAVAENAEGVGYGEDETLTTLLTSASGATTEPTVPARATDGGVSVEATGGVGSMTVGHYGSEIGGPALAFGKGAYFQVYRSTGSTFTKIEYQDCELGGAKTLWWDNPATGWEPIAAPTAVYTEMPTPCITVTATESTKPSVAQLSDPRHVGGPSASEQYGKCEPTKHGRYSDTGCMIEDVKKGKPKGKFEWFPDPVGCYAMKKGHFGEGCTKEEFSESKKTHEKKYKGKYERGSNSFAMSGGAFVLAVAGQSRVECTASGSSNGSMRAPNEGVVTLTLTGCARAGVACESGSQAGTIVSAPLESYSYEEGGEYFVALAAQRMMGFTCGNTELVLSGTAAGQLKATLNAPITTSETNFSESVGAQELELEETKTAVRHPATLTTETTTTTEQAGEIRAH